MASGRVFFFFFFLAIIFPAAMVSATDFIVGDESGWTVNFDYQAWAQGKDFWVGDRLIFQYLAGFHNVFKVNGTEFQNCIVPPLTEALTSGNDTIMLATPGRKWYICGVAQHCAVGGQKLLITVNSQTEPPTGSALHSPPTAASPAMAAPPSPSQMAAPPTMAAPPSPYQIKRDTYSSANAIGIPYMFQSLVAVVVVGIGAVFRLH